MVVASIRESGRTAPPFSVLAQARRHAERPPAEGAIEGVLFDGVKQAEGHTQILRLPATFRIGEMFLEMAQSFHNRGLYDRAALAFERALAYLPLERKFIAMKGKGDALLNTGHIFGASLAYMDEGALCEEVGRDGTEAYLRARELIDGLKGSQAASPYWLLQRAVILLSLAHAQTRLENLAIAKELRFKALDALTGHLVQTGAIQMRNPNSAEVHRLKAELEAAIGMNSPSEARKNLENLWNNIEETKGSFLTGAEMLALDAPFAAQDMSKAAAQLPDLLNGGLSLFPISNICPPPFAMPFARAI